MKIVYKTILWLVSVIVAYMIGSFVYDTYRAFEANKNMERYIDIASNASLVSSNNVYNRASSEKMFNYDSYTNYINSLYSSNDEFLMFCADVMTSERDKLLYSDATDLAITPSSLTLAYVDYNELVSEFKLAMQAMLEADNSFLRGSVYIDWSRVKITVNNETDPKAISPQFITLSPDVSRSIYGSELSLTKLFGDKLDADRYKTFESLFTSERQIPVYYISYEVPYYYCTQSPFFNVTSLNSFLNGAYKPARDRIIASNNYTTKSKTPLSREGQWYFSMTQLTQQVTYSIVN